MKQFDFTFYYIFNLLLFLNLTSIAQRSDTTFTFKNQLGIGVMKYSSNEYMLSLSANKEYKNNSELSVLLYSFQFNRRKQISASLAYNWATTKKRSRFILYLNTELNLFCEWRNKINSNKYTMRYGPFIVLGLTPTYRISPRIKLNLEFKLGPGYLWGYNNKYSFQDKTFDEYSVGWFLTALPAVRVNYYFHKTKK
ncbi:MAG: hypothetical protein ACO1G9_15605 [Bacteroidota bacterium]